MPEQLFIRLSPGGPEEASWIVIDAAGNCIGAPERGPLTAAARKAGQRRVSVLVPGIDVLLTSVELAVRSQAKLVQAIPFALEEQLAEDVHRLHFAVGRRGPGGKVPVAVVAQERLDGWLAQLAAAGLTPHAIHPDTAGIPITPDGVTLLLDGDRVYVREDDHTPLVLRVGTAEAVLTVVGILPQRDADDEGAAPQRFMVYLGEGDQAHFNAAVEALRARVADPEVKRMAGGALAHMAMGVLRTPPPNLLQGRYAPQSGLENLWRPWRVAATLLGALLLLLTAGKGIELVKLRSIEAELDSQIAGISRQAFPNIQRWVNPKVQIERELERRRATASVSPETFLQTLVALGSVMADMPATQIEALSFRNSVMDIKLMAPNVDTLDRIQKQVTDRAGLVAEIQSANPRETGVEGRMQIRRPGV